MTQLVCPLCVQEGFIDIKLVENLFSNRIIWCWENYKSWIQYDRKKLNAPKHYDSIEELYHRLKQRAQQSTVST